MNPRQKQIHVTWYVILAVVSVALILAADHVGLFEGIDNHLYDLSFRIRGGLKPDNRIVIVAIDEKTLEQLGRWPLGRIHYVSLLDSLREAAAVGFDIIMAEPAADDAELRAEMVRHGRTVLPLYIEHSAGISYPAHTLAPSATGHIHIEQGVDGIVRQVFHQMSFKGHEMHSFASVIYETASGASMSRRNVEKQGELEAGRILQSMPMNINYYGPPGTFPRISLADVIRGNYSHSFFKDKIVLVGVTAEGLGDKKLVPFSQERNLMPGVEIHANIVNNLSGQNPIRVADERVRSFSAILLSFIGIFVFLKLSEKTATIFWLTALIAITSGMYLFFAYGNLWISPSLFYFTLSFLYLAAYILKLDAAARKLDLEYRVISSRIGGADSVRHAERAAAGRGIIGYFSPGGINTRVEKLITLEQQYEKQLEDTVRQRTQELTDALSMINTMSNEMISRLAKAAESKEFGTGEHIVRVGLYASEIARMLGMSEEFIDLITFASPMHDLGKIGIPDNILMKPGDLNETEFNIMKTHTLIGENILSKSSFPKVQLSASIALNHHERWDGSGYPRGLKGHEIPIEARIVMVCDIYDAMRSPRPYKTAYEHHKVVEIIIEGDAKTSPEHFDPQVLQAFIRLAPRFEEIFALHQTTHTHSGAIAS